MPKPTAEQVVVIVGASSGIGRAAAAAFAAEGAQVVCAARNETALDTLVDEIRRNGGTAIAVPTDVADPAAVRALVTAAEDRFGRIDTWVNTAAVGVWGRVEDVTDEEFERVMRVNFLGHVHGVHAAVPALLRAGGGTVIGVSSAEGVQAIPLQSPYVSSKFALRGFYDCLRMELAQDGAPIAVSTILPASVDTPFFEQARSKLGALPKPPPPVYAPELVAATIVRAATNPRREIPVGGAAAALYLTQRFCPALTEAVLSIRRIAYPMQTTDNPPSAADNVDRPLDGPGRVHGTGRDVVLRHSPFTRLLAFRPRPGELATAALRRLRSQPGTR